ncbi:MAG: hypothetical protein JWN32_3778 [Solirubrobacterales bacterium]|nr:hypothetical protein [Solirubrobacterales bacterium]
MLLADDVGERARTMAAVERGPGGHEFESSEGAGQYRAGPMRRLSAPAWISGLAAVVWLVWHHGFANYDTLYALVWGRELAHGQTPGYKGSLTPTPHPLAEAAGFVLTPLGDGAATAMVVIAFLALGAVGYLVYRLGALWFGRAAGVLAAAIVLTREPVLSYGSRAYVDLPYVALVLAAVLVEARRPRAGAPVLGLLAAAGLVRPEAWAFSAVYLVWLAAGQRERDWRALAVPAAIAASGPFVWLVSDWLIAGGPFWSLTGTRDNAATLHRVTGLQHVPITVPRRLGEILREPVLLGAAGGVVLSLLWLRRRALAPAVVGLVAIAAFALLAAAGLPIITRYLILPAAILAIFCGAGVFGWLRLAREDPRRRWWMAFAAVTVLALATFVPSQYHRLRNTRRALATQQTIERDLKTIVRRAPCRPISVPNHRPLPLVALVLDVRPSTVLDATLATPARGTFVDPASARVSRNFILDPHDPHPLVPRVPPGFRRGAANPSWVLYSRCR